MIVSLFTSLAMSFEKQTEFCGIESGCEIVENSMYSSTLGIKNYIFGIAVFAFLVYLTNSHINNPTKDKKHLLELSLIVGSIIAIYFLYLQEYVLFAYCKYCIIIDFSIIIATIIFYFFKDHNRQI
jgi:uncharacterized membrane protein